MPEIKFGPGVKHFILWVTIVTTFLGGVYVGWNSRGSWGLQTELATHIADSKKAKEIYEWLFNEELIIRKEIDNVDVKKLPDCAKQRMSDLMQQPTLSN